MSSVTDYFEDFAVAEDASKLLYIIETQAKGRLQMTDVKTLQEISAKYFDLPEGRRTKQNNKNNKNNKPYLTGTHVEPRGS